MTQALSLVREEDCCGFHPLILNLDSINEEVEDSILDQYENMVSLIPIFLNFSLGFDFDERESEEAAMGISTLFLLWNNFPLSQSNNSEMSISIIVNALQSKPGGGEEWLCSLRKMELRDVVSTLSTLPDVGPKVVACIALFLLDQHHVVLVDTYVWRRFLEKERSKFQRVLRALLCEEWQRTELEEEAILRA
ncbi:hypothetical protein JHK82_048130 [Glycine max]|nr:hypothetical protein JHK82_048130 [Glycine max]